MSKAPKIDATIPDLYAKARYGTVLTDAAYRRGYVAGLSPSTAQADNPYVDSQRKNNFIAPARWAWDRGFCDGSLRRKIGVRA